MTDQKRYVRKDVLNTKVDKDLILLDEKAGKYYATSDVGLAIWGHLSKPLTLDELCARLSVEYDVAPEDCARDTSDFLDALRNADLVTQVV